VLQFSHDLIKVTEIWLQVKKFSLFQGFRNPHGIAISPNGTAMYVTEIGPNKVWKFSLVSSSGL
jgi:sugar lactone lactonase YvrE